MEENGMHSHAEHGNEKTINISDGSIVEQNGELIFTVSLTGTLEAGETLTVNLETFDGSATGGSDYAGLSGSVTFDSNTYTHTFSVPIKDDKSDDNYINTQEYIFRYKNYISQQNTHAFITKQDNIYNCLKILNSLDEREVA